MTDIRQPDADPLVAALSIQDARETCPREAARVLYHLREAQQLLEAHETKRREVVEG